MESCRTDYTSPSTLDMERIRGQGNTGLCLYIEKWPVLSPQEFDDSFPKDCTIACKLVEEREMSYIVDTSRPWSIESEEGLTVFQISKNLLLKIL